MKNNTVFVRLHHGSLIVENLPDSLHFYCNIIGLTENLQRPEMGYKGAWFDIGEQQIHLLNLPRTEPFNGQSALDQKYSQPEHAGRDRHLAIHVTEIEGIKNKLEDNQIPYTMSKSGRQALFCRDPDGNGLEFIKV